MWVLGFEPFFFFLSNFFSEFSLIQGPTTKQRHFIFVLEQRFNQSKSQCCKLTAVPLCSPVRVWWDFWINA